METVDLLDKWRGVFLVDLGDLLFSVDIRLIECLDPASAAIVTAGAELAFRAAAAPQGFFSRSLRVPRAWCP